MIDLFLFKFQTKGVLFLKWVSIWNVLSKKKRPRFWMVLPIYVYPNEAATSK